MKVALDGTDGAFRLRFRFHREDERIFPLLRPEAKLRHHLLLEDRKLERELSDEDPRIVGLRSHRIELDVVLAAGGTFVYVSEAPRSQRRQIGKYFLNHRIVRLRR